MIIEQYYDANNDKNIINIIITSHEDLINVKKIIKMFAYDAASYDDEISSYLKVIKDKFTLKVVSCRSEIDDNVQVYFSCNVIFDEGKNQVNVFELGYDTRVMTIKEIVKNIYNQFIIAIENYKPLKLLPDTNETML